MTLCSAGGNQARRSIERQQVAAYLGRCDDGVNWGMIRAACRSLASLCVVPMQDALGLGSEARMNVPSRGEGNWRWRFSADALRPELAQKLAALSRGLRPASAAFAGNRR